MSFHKQDIIDFVARLPEDCTVSDAIEQLRLLQKIERGIEDADNGRVLDHDEFFDSREVESR
ncbi:MAG: hypothetical protein ACR2FY_16715 [Pirellulaceae bacterium]